MLTLDTKLARSLRMACLWNLALVVASFGAAALLDIYYRLFGVSLVLGWLPLLVVALRRPQTPTRADYIAMFGGFPVVFTALAWFGRLYFRL